jgi:effector-binding domain-containing protein
MRTLRYIVLAFLFLLVVVVIVGFFLPAKVHLQRSIEINRKAPVVFNVINSLGNFNKWSPWYELDVSADYTVTGPISGVGSKLTWQGNDKVGKGSNEIIESKENTFIKTKFFFGKDDQPAFSTLTLSEKNQVTTVTWSFENDFGYNVFYRYFGLVLEDMIAPDYEKGLKKLKVYVESLPLYDYSQISIVNTPAESVYTVARQVHLDSEDITEEIGKAYSQIITFLTKNNISMQGSPKIITQNSESEDFTFLAAIPVQTNAIIDPAGFIQSQQMYQGKAIKLIHKGSYSNFKQQYEIINTYMSQNQLHANGQAWEDFVTDPAIVKEKNLITYIYQPIK